MRLARVYDVFHQGRPRSLPDPGVVGQANREIGDLGSLYGAHDLFTPGQIRRE